MSTKLGEMLVGGKVISEAQLKRALETQQQIGGALGTILTKLRILTEEQLARFLAEQLKIPVLGLSELVVEKNVSALVDTELMEKHQFIPIRRGKDALTVAMVDPMDLDAQDELGFLTGLRIEPAAAARSHIVKAIDYYFHGKLCPEIQAAEQNKGIAPGQHAGAGDGTRASPQAVLQALMELLIEKKILTQEELLARMRKSAPKQ